MKRTGAGDFLNSDSIKSEVSGYLREGGAVIYPTDTLYGLGVDVRSSGAMKNLFEIKGRERGKAVPLIIDGVARVKEVFDEFSPLGEKLAAHFWPGKLTIVARAHPHIAAGVGSLDGTVGLRVPRSAVACTLAGLTGGILTGTSANKSGGLFPLLISAVLEDFEREEVWVIDGGDLMPSRGSTVLVLDEESFRVLREGDIPVDEIVKILEEIGNG